MVPAWVCPIGHLGRVGSLEPAVDLGRMQCRAGLANRHCGNVFTIVELPGEGITIVLQRSGFQPAQFLTACLFALPGAGDVS